MLVFGGNTKASYFQSRTNKPLINQPTPGHTDRLYHSIEGSFTVALYLCFPTPDILESVDGTHEIQHRGQIHDQP